MTSRGQWRVIKVVFLQQLAARETKINSHNERQLIKQGKYLNDDGISSNLIKCTKYSPSAGTKISVKR